MGKPVTINAKIVEALYCEALVLSDEVRHAFCVSAQATPPGPGEDMNRIALSCEGLRTTTRMVQAIGWLLNRRAHLLGELSEFHLRRHGRLSGDARGSDPQQLALLEPHVRDLVEMTTRFYERLLRLDNAWHAARSSQPTAIDRLRERLEQRLAS